MSDDKPSAPFSPMSTGAQIGFDDREDNAPVTIGRFGSVIEAELAKSRLEARELPAMILDDGTAGVAPHLSLAIGGVRLQVPRWAEAEALDALETPLATSEDPVFRVRYTLAGALAAVGGATGAAVAFVAKLALGAPAGLPLEPLALLLGLAVGGVYGARQKRAYCSRLGCAGRLSNADVVCPGCGGRVVGELDRREDRLTALEAWQDAEAARLDSPPANVDAAPSDVDAAGPAAGDEPVPVAGRATTTEPAS